MMHMAGEKTKKMNENNSLKLEHILSERSNRGKTLFLHSCCAPCSSYVLEYLRSFFCITVFYFNPNITEEPEYRKRVEEQKRLIKEFNKQYDVQKDLPDCELFPIEIVEGEYDKQLFLESVKGLEQCKEGGERCKVCFELRLRETARLAKERQMDFFTTTLTISPLKNAAVINEIGQSLGTEYGIAFLPSDFKKKNGYKRSIELSKEYDLYRQDYCGCAFSKAERKKLRNRQRKDLTDGCNMTNT